MAREANLVKYTLPSAGAITQFRLVNVNASGQVAQATVAGQQCIAVAQNAPTAANLETELAMLGGGGVMKVEAGAATTAGGQLASDTSGRVVDAGVGDDVVGVGIEAAAGAGSIISMIAVSNHENP